MTRRAVYDAGLGELLAEAARAYRRRDDGAFRALLEEGVARVPQRLDLRLNLANRHIQAGDAAAAAGVFREAVGIMPRDADALTYLAHWERYLGNRVAAEGILSRLNAACPSRGRDLGRIWLEVDRRLALPVGDVFPEPCGGRLAILVLGYVLHDDGGMDDLLVERLEKALAAAERWPGAVLVVSGGVPRGGRVEAEAMRDWLLGRGVSGERIVAEGYARDVVENLLYGRQILEMLGVDVVLCVTSAVDVRRAEAGLNILSWSGGSGWREVCSAAASLVGWRDDGGDGLKLYRDVLRVYGMPMMRSFPELAEL